MKNEKPEKSDTTHKDEYTVQELIQELMADDSWEPDPEYRAKAVGFPCNLL